MQQGDSRRRGLRDGRPSTDRWIALVIGALAVGCDDKRRPWSGREGPAAVLAPPAAGGTGEAVEADPGAVASTPTASNEGGSPSGSPSVAPSPPSLAVTTAPSAPVVLLPGLGEPEVPAGRTIAPGGLWESCHRGVALSGDPLKDVTRIGLLCGPSNGLRRKTAQAIVGVIGERDPPVVAELRVARGACYRVIGVSDEGAEELDVTVRSSRDVAVAADHSKGRLAIVQPDRPFCTFADDVFSIDFTARRGSGRFAAEVWAIGEPRRRGGPIEAPADERPMDDP